MVFGCCLKYALICDSCTCVYGQGESYNHLPWILIAYRSSQAGIVDWLQIRSCLSGIDLLSSVWCYEKCHFFAGNFVCQWMVMEFVMWLFMIKYMCNIKQSSFDHQNFMSTKWMYLMKLNCEYIFMFPFRVG